jgi:hypothetical protein
VVTIWSERWCEPQARLQALHDALAGNGGFVRSGGPFDRWDLDLRAAPLGGVKIRAAVEEHGDGRQLLRARIWPRVSVGGSFVAGLLVLLAASAWLDHQVGVALALTLAVVAVIAVGVEGTVTAMSLALGVMRRLEDEETSVVAGEREERPPDDPAALQRRSSPAALPHEAVVLSRFQGRSQRGRR